MRPEAPEPTGLRQALPAKCTRYGLNLGGRRTGADRFSPEAVAGSNADLSAEAGTSTGVVTAPHSHPANASISEERADGTKPEREGNRSRITTVRLRPTEDEALNRIREAARIRGVYKESEILRLAILGAAKIVEEARSAGMKDRQNSRPHSHSSIGGSDVDLVVVGYNSGYYLVEERRPGSYSEGLVQGRADRESGASRRHAEPLSTQSRDFEVGHFDGYFGGYVSGIGYGRADRECGRAYTPPPDDPLFMSFYAVGYRIGYRLGAGVPYREKSSSLGGLAVGPVVGGVVGTFVSELPGGSPDEFADYRRGLVKGQSDHMDGRPGNPPSEPEAMVEGYRDGVRGGFGAGLEEGEADVEAGCHRNLIGDIAFSEYAFGYRTAARYLRVGDEVENEYCDYLDGRALGEPDRVQGKPDQEAGAAGGWLPFRAGYRAGYDGELAGYRRGKAQGEADRERGHHVDVGPDSFGSGYASGQTGYRRPLWAVKKAFYPNHPSERVMSQIAKD